MPGISGHGTTLTGATSGVLGYIRNISVGGMSINDIDVSSNEATERWREFVAGMKDAGELTLDLIYEKANHDTVQDALGLANEAWTILFPDSSTFVCNGYINNLGIEIPMDDAITQSAGLKLSGKPVFTAAS